MYSLLTINNRTPHGAQGGTAAPAPRRALDGTKALRPARGTGAASSSACLQPRRWQGGRGAESHMAASMLQT